MSRIASRTLDVWLSAAAYWYLTGLLAALGFSLGFYLLKPAAGAAGFDRDLLQAFTWMDGKWYKQIATEGYRYNPESRSNVAFFPVYPLIARGVIAVSGARAEAALLIVSHLSLLAALALLAFYVRRRHAAAPCELPDYTLLAAALFPTSCFFRFAYSESTFLLLAVLGMYAMLRRWRLGSIAAIVGLATAARPVGVALLAPLAIHIVRCSVPSLSRRGRAAEHSQRARLRDIAHIGARLAIYLPLACWGLAAFMAYQQYAFGDAFAAFKAHGHWGVRPDGPWSEKAESLATLAAVASVYDDDSPAFWMKADTHGIPWFSLQFANPILFAGAVVLIALGAWVRVDDRAGKRGAFGPHGESADDRLPGSRCLSPEEWSLAAAMLLIPYVARAYEMGMGSMGRFTCVVFPIYLVLGHLVVRLPGALRAALFALCGFFLASYAALYAAGYDIF